MKNVTTALDKKEREGGKKQQPVLGGRKNKKSWSTEAENDAGAFSVEREGEKERERERERERENVYKREGERKRG